MAPPTASGIRSAEKPLELVDAPVASLHPHPRNPRKIAPARLEQLQRTLAAEPAMLRARPLIALPDGTVVAGNQRLAAAVALGWETIPVVYAELDEEQATRWMLLDNRGFGEDDEAAAAELLAELAQAGADLDLTGFASADVDRLLRSLQRSSVDADAVPALPVVARSERGVMYELGPHRLMCGDSRDPRDFETLMGGGRAALVFTSPPYASQRAYDPASGFTPIAPDDYEEWFAPVASNIAAALASDGSYCLNLKEHCDGGERHLYATDLHITHVRSWGWRWVDTFCWRDLKNGVPGAWANRFKDAWEPVHHYTRSAKIHVDHLANGRASDAVFAYSSDSQKTATGSGLLGEKATSERRGIARPSNVVEVAASSAGGSSAAFPVDLPAWFIRSFAPRGLVVLDPFLGSGSTLIAAEREGRVCYGLELSPGYCDVIRQRYADLTDRPELAP